MSTQGRRGGVSLPERRLSQKNKPEPNDDQPSGILAKLANSEIVSKGKQLACDAAEVTNKLLRSTGRAAWISGTTFLILAIPLFIEMDRENQYLELELQQQSLLGAPPAR